MNEMNAMTMLDDDMLAAVAGGCGGHKRRPKRHCHKRDDYSSSVTQNQNQSVDIGGDLIVSGGSSVTINFGNQSQAA